MKINYISKDNKISTKEIKQLDDKMSLNKDMLSQYIRVFNNNQRSARAVVKTRAEVSGGGKKPWRQKGTGNARAGSSRSPVWVGGGVTHGPRNRNWSLKIGKKHKQTLFKQVLVERIKANSITVVDFPQIKVPNLKTATTNISSIVSENKSVLVVTSSNPTLVKSLANLNNVETTDISQLSSRDLAKFSHIVVTGSAFEKLVERV